MTEKVQKTDHVREENALTPVVGESITITPPTHAPGGKIEAPVSVQKKSGRLASLLKMAACCGGALLLLPALGLVSMGGLAAVGGSFLSIAAVLACPVGMYFMMRGMMKAGGHAGHGSDAGSDGKRLPPPTGPGPSA